MTDPIMNASVRLAEVGQFDTAQVAKSPNKADPVVTYSAASGLVQVKTSGDRVPELQPPQALSNTSSAAAIEQFEAALGTFFDNTQAMESLLPTLSAVSGVLVGQASGRLSPGAADLELEALLATVVTEKSKIDRERILQARSENVEKIQQNQDKMAESLNAAKEAKKSGLFAKIFGWIGAIVSVIVGIVMCATGVGAAAGALMIAGGVVGIVSNAVQQAAQDGLISKEVMSALGPVLMAVEILVAVASLVVTFGASAAGAVAKVASKVASKAGGMVAELAASLAQKASKAANLAAKTVDVASKSVSTGVKVATTAPKIATDLGSAASSLASNVMEHKSAVKEAEGAQSRADLDAGEALVKRLVAEYAPTNNALQDALDLFQQMLRSNADTQEQVFNQMNGVSGSVR